MRLNHAGWRGHVAAAVLLAAATAVGAGPRYTVTLIPTVPGEAGNLHFPDALNDQGWVVGTYGTIDFGDEFGYRTFLYRPGEGSFDIGSPPEAPALITIAPSDVNNLGQVSGTATAADDPSAGSGRTFRWQAGAFTLFPQFVPGRGTNTGLMNDAGRLVGYANDGSFIGKKALEFIPPSTLAQLFPTTPGYNAALDINNRSEILASSVDGVLKLQPGGGQQVLPPPASNRGFDPISMNDLGDVVGESRPVGHSETSAGAVWLEGLGWRLPSSTGRFNRVVSINNRREVVGNSQDGAIIGNHSFYWTPGEPVTVLSERIDPPGSYRVIFVKDINNVGQIVGVVANGTTGTTYGAILTPIEPGIAGPCSADFNHDGDVGTDLDIEAFFRCLAGTCCPACGTADFNGDGDVGTDRDIEAFFRVLAGGSC